ncbi:DUF6483 family protein [Clostridium chrysemydis]|uniref:DUF6483 family protein n=1 Tax=Clostridium chrysemydis TaxID=2665504 RepID=UPI001883647E|nr:DUF6483 family protein [Clostridium chrysemydis]
MLKSNNDSKVKININSNGNDAFKILFTKLVFYKDYNQAEDMLFKELEENKSEEIYDIGFEFYESLKKIDEEELLKSDFSLEEVLRGIEDLKRIMDIEI